MSKSLVLFQICILQGLLVCLVVGDTNLGPSDFQCPTGKTISPHPEKCEQYYTCYGGQPTYLWQCRDNLLFDLVYDGCNWPEQTYCGNRTRPDGSPTATVTNTVIYSTSPTTSSPLLSSQKPYTCPEDGFFASDFDRCVQNFYTCLDGFPFSTSCPSYGVFDPVGRKCVSPSHSACKNAPPLTTFTTGSSTPSGTIVVTTRSSTSAPDNTTPSSGGFVCPGTGYYADPTSCSHYYMCDNGISYRMVCPGGLVFNPVTGVCDWPSAVPGCTKKP